MLCGWIKKRWETDTSHRIVWIACNWLATYLPTLRYAPNVRQRTGTLLGGNVEHNSRHSHFYTDCQSKLAVEAACSVFTLSFTTRHISPCIVRISCSFLCSPWLVRRHEETTDDINISNLAILRAPYTVCVFVFVSLCFSVSLSLCLPVAVSPCLYVSLSLCLYVLQRRQSGLKSGGSWTRVKKNRISRKFSEKF